MANGSITSAQVLPLAGLSARTTNATGQGYVLNGVPRRDVGYVTSDRSFRVYLWNGTGADVILKSIATDVHNAEGIVYDADPPELVASGNALPIVFTVTVDGPLQYEAVFDFVSACALVQRLVITGTRAPHLSADIGYLFFPHNWERGLDESLAWKTDILISHDRTEQRIQLRTLPRRSWEVRMVVSGAGRRKLETWLGLRKSRYLFVPIWRDAVRLAGDIATNSVTIPITEDSDNLVIGTPVAVWSDWETAEVRTISGVGSNYISVDTPFSQSWSAGLTMVAPCRYCLSLEQRRVNRFTEEVGDYRLTLLATGDAWEPSGAAVELYRGLPLCPFVPSWEGGEEGYDNKWVRLDNDTGVLEFDVQSMEPVLTRDARFLLIGRANINTFLAFLKARAGRLAPFWLAANERGVELAADANAGATFIVIQAIDYEFALKDSPAREHIELITTEGTVIRRMITGVETQPSGEEKLLLDSALPVAVSAATLNRCAWLELVRFDSDEITLHWVSGDCLEVTIPIVVLP
jgi:hypothetical protein